MVGAIIAARGNGNGIAASPRAGEVDGDGVSAVWRYLGGVEEQEWDGEDDV